MKVKIVQSQATIKVHSQTWIATHMNQVCSHQPTVDLKLHRRLIHQQFGFPIILRLLLK